MRILVNCSNIKKGGGIQVALSFIEQVYAIRGHEWHIILSNTLVNNIELVKEANKQNISTYHYTINPNIFSSITGLNKKLNEIEKRINPDAVFTIFGPSYWRPKKITFMWIRKPQYISPNSPYFDIISRKRKLKLQLKKNFHLYDFKKFNNALVSESEFVSDRLKIIFPNKPVFTVSNTHHQFYLKPEKWKYDKIVEDFTGFSLLTITSNYPHKNLKIIPEVIDYLSISYPEFKFRFLLTVTKEELSNISQRHENYITFYGKVNIEECPPLYQKSDAMFLPTLMECFSASYPEAMFMQKPILTSDLDFAHSICGDAAVYFDPLDPVSIGRSIYELSISKEKQEELKKAGTMQLSKFETAESRAMKYVDILEKLYETAHTKL